MKNRPNSIKAIGLAKRTAGAYSTFAYASWPAVAEALLDRGLTEREAEAVMFSKWMRWAGDSYEGGSRYGRYPVRAILEFLNSLKNERADIEELTREHWATQNKCTAHVDI